MNTHPYKKQLIRPCKKAADTQPHRIIIHSVIIRCIREVGTHKMGWRVAHKQKSAHKVFWPAKKFSARKNKSRSALSSADRLKSFKSSGNRETLPARFCFVHLRKWITCPTCACLLPPVTLLYLKSVTYTASTLKQSCAIVEHK